MTSILCASRKPEPVLQAFYPFDEFSSFLDSWGRGIHTAHNALPHCSTFLNYSKREPCSSEENAADGFPSIGRSVSLLLKRNRSVSFPRKLDFNYCHKKLNVCSVFYASQTAKYVSPDHQRQYKIPIEEAR